MTAPTQPWSRRPSGTGGLRGAHGTTGTGRQLRDPRARPVPVRPLGAAPPTRLPRRGQPTACSAVPVRDRVAALAVVALVAFAVAFGLVLLGQVASAVPGTTSMETPRLSGAVAVPERVLDAR